MRMPALALVLASLAGPAFAQEAIVLSAGGARGLAHAGVLQELHAKGHDPDIVAGASMGAIVGALYAAGWSPDSIAQRVEKQDWREMFAPLSVPFGGTGEPRHPVFRLGARGYLSDWRTNRELAHLLFEPSARARGDWDRLPRTLRIAATDIESGEAVVLARGDLARAVRASVAQPGFFPTVHLNGRELVDAGVRDYLPIDAARAAGARLVLASDAIRPRTLDADTAAAFGVAQRSLDWLTVHGSATHEPPDVLFLPDVDPATSPIVYPSDPTPFLRAGREVVARASLPASRARASRPAEAPPARLGATVVDSKLYAPFLERGFDLGGTFDAAAVLRRVDRAYATGLFDAVWVSVESPEEAPPLVVRATPRKAQTVLGAIGYDEDRGGRAWLSLRRAVMTGARPLDASLDGSIDGVTRSAALVLRAPTFTGLTLVASGSVRETEPRGFEEVTRTGGAVGVEYRMIAPDAYAAVLLRAENVDDANGRDGASIGPELALGLGAPLVQVVGIETKLEGTVRSGDVDYERGVAQASVALGRRTWLAAPLAAVAKVSEDAPLDAWPALGDDHLLPGLRWGDRRGRTMALGGLDVARVFPKRTTLIVRMRGGRIEDRADGGEDETLGGGSLSALWWLPFGRIELGYEGTTLGERRAAVRLGASF